MASRKRRVRDLKLSEWRRTTRPFHPMTLLILSIVPIILLPILRAL